LGSKNPILEKMLRDDGPSGVRLPLKGRFVLAPIRDAFSNDGLFHPWPGGDAPIRHEQEP
jgi:hypothetical protein